MSTRNDEATRVMREAAERKYAALGERHPYSGVCWGLAAVLLREGVRPEGDIPAHRVGESDESTLAWELTSRFHCPLVNFDPFAVTVGTIARAIADELYLGLARRPDDTDRRCSLYDVRFGAEACADFDVYEREIVARLKAQKIRRGSKRHAEFVRQNAERVVGTIRNQVEKGLAERRERLTTLRSRIEAEARSAIDAADGVSIGDLVREGMERRQNLAAFLPPKEG